MKEFPEAAAETGQLPHEILGEDTTGHHPLSHCGVYLGFVHVCMQVPRWPMLALFLDLMLEADPPVSSAASG
jgi:hypothetical protein